MPDLIHGIPQDMDSQNRWKKEILQLLRIWGHFFSFHCHGHFQRNCICKVEFFVAMQGGTAKKAQFGKEHTCIPPANSASHKAGKNFSQQLYDLCVAETSLWKIKW